MICFQLILFLNLLIMHYWCTKIHYFLLWILAALISNFIYFPWCGCVREERQKEGWWSTGSHPANPRVFTDNQKESTAHPSAASQVSVQIKHYYTEKISNPAHSESKGCWWRAIWNHHDNIVIMYFYFQVNWWIFTKGYNKFRRIWKQNWIFACWISCCSW